MEAVVELRRRALYKGGPVPPWKDTYRRRCVERLKNSRARLLDKYRRLEENAAGAKRGALLVQEVMEVEWRALQSADVELPSFRRRDVFPQMLEDSDELAILEEIQQELMMQEQLAIEEYERSLQFDEECLNAMLDGFNAEGKVVCPVCRRHHLAVGSCLVTCSCGLCIGTQDMTEEKLRLLLEDSVAEHGHHCLHSPKFAVTGGAEAEANLLMICQTCDSWAIIL